MDFETIEIKENEQIPFTWITHDYGRAEFVCCPIWKRGKITDLYISPKQQPDKRAILYHFKCGYSSSLNLTSTVGLDNPEVWNVMWCQTHKTQALEVYVPKNSKNFSIRAVSSLYVWFR